MGKPYTHVLRPVVHSSDVVALQNGATEIEITIKALSPHFAASIEFYSDENGFNPVLPDSGSSLFKVKTPVLPNFFQEFDNNLLHCCSPSQVEWAAFTNAVHVDIEGVTGDPAYCRLFVCAMTS